MKKNLIPVALGAALLGAACGSGGHTTHDATASSSGRIENIDMTDIAYSSTSLTASKGETVTFHFTNKGKIVHEAIIGDHATQEAHAKEMSSSSGMGASDMSHGMDHGGSDALTLDAGHSADLTYTFDKTGTIIIGCHEPGHYEAGMKITITVT